VHVLGKQSIDSYIERVVVPDLVLLGSLSLAIILVFELAITRSLAAGIILWLTTLPPSVWTLALLPPLGLRLGIDRLFVPLIIQALSTSNGIQLFRYLALGASSTMEAALDVITPVILGAGLSDRGEGSTPRVVFLLRRATTLIGLVGLMLLFVPIN